MRGPTVALPAPGRAEGAFKYTLAGRGTSFRFRWQPGERRIPLTQQATYTYGLGSSLIYQWNSRLSVGAAFNFAPVDLVTEELKTLGIDGDSRSVLLGAL
jgi:hypothetical protein